MYDGKVGENSRGRGKYDGVGVKSRGIEEKNREKKVSVKIAT